MADAEEATPKKDVIKSFDFSDLTKLFGVLSALAYGTGVVAINTYLHGLGIADFSFAKPKFLLTGTLIFSTFLLLAAAPISFTWRKACCLARPEGTPPFTYSSRGVFLIGILSFVALLIASCLVCFGEESPLGQGTGWWVQQFIKSQGARARSWENLVTVVLGVYIPVWAAALSIYQARRLVALINAEKLTLRMSLERFYFAVAIGCLFISLIGYVLKFTFAFYPFVAQEFGGGEPYFESFAIPQDEQCNLQRIGIPFQPNVPGITEPLPVLHETDTLVAIWLQCEWGKNCNYGHDGPEAAHSVVVQIDKSAITAMRTYKSIAVVPPIQALPDSCKTDKKSDATHDR